MSTAATTAPIAVRFTEKRASYWNGGNRRWQAIGRDKARAMIATGQAEELPKELWW